MIAVGYDLRDLRRRASARAQFLVHDEILTDPSVTRRVLLF